MNGPGSRPLPSCLGGGDLDGDVYNLVPLRELPEFTPNLTSTPALYNAAPKKVLDRPSTMDDVAEFFVDYINNDVSMPHIFLILPFNPFRLGAGNYCYELANNRRSKSRWYI